jgi:hypothetical protein
MPNPQAPIKAGMSPLILIFGGKRQNQTLEEVENIHLA